MNKTFWNTRYAAHANVYGEQPNSYFKRFIDTHRSGSILLAAEGEGRNGIYAASKGWKVDAFDFNEVAREKALKTAQAKKLSINYEIKDIASFRTEKKYDVVALIYVHMPADLRQHLHREVYNSIKSGGFLVLEAFAKEQLHFSSGGPKDISMLYDAPTICNDFPFLHILSCGQKEIDLDEGVFHKGRAAVLQLTGQKL